MSTSGPLLIIPSVGTTADTMGVHARRVLRIGRGDITRWAADAIATSANAGLCGNRAPSYWRFQRRPYNIDGAVHAAAGPALATALSELADARGFPYSSPTRSLRTLARSSSALAMPRRKRKAWRRGYSAQSRAGLAEAAEPS